MKKLLAMILCALMLLGASAFAEAADYSMTAGAWALKEDEIAAAYEGELFALIEMDGEGRFIACDAEGNEVCQGTMDCVDEYGDGTFRYDLIDAEGELRMGFYFDGEKQFCIGNGDAPIYTLIELPSEADFAKTAGKWAMVEDENAVVEEGDFPVIEMDGAGSFIAKDAEGNEICRGTMDIVDEYGDGTYRYDLYDAEGEWRTGFYFDSETEFHVGNGDGPVYTLIAE